MKKKKPLKGELCPAFYCQKMRTSFYLTESELIPGLKAAGRRVSIAPQQPLPVLSVSHFLPHNTVKGGLPTHHRLHFNTLPLVSSSQPTTAPELSLKETPWLSPVDSAVFPHQWGEKCVWAGASVNHKKGQCSPQRPWQLANAPRKKCSRCGISTKPWHKTNAHQEL